jgi:hypothetical protein
MYLKQATASQSVLIGPFIDTDGAPTTGLTIDAADIRLSKNGGNIVAKNSGGGTHDELGMYTITLDATDTDTVGRLQLTVVETGALPVYHEFQVVEEAVYDALFGASALGYIANAPVNVAQISGDGTAADNAESFFDGTGYAGTNNVIPTVTTLTGHTAQTGDCYARLGAPAGASVSADVAAVKAETATIVADTAELQGDWANGGRLDLILDARASQASVDTIDDIVDDILVDTGTTLPATLATIGGYLDTEVAAILAAVDTEVAAIKAKTDSLTFTVAGEVDSNVQSINGTTVIGDGGTPPWGPA